MGESNEESQLVTKGGFMSGGVASMCKQYAPALTVILLVIIISSVCYCKDGFASPDGVVARKGNNQTRSDSHVDKKWNLKELEKSVALLNSKS